MFVKETQIEKNSKSYLGDKKQKVMFPVVSQSDVHFGLAPEFVACPIEKSCRSILKQQIFLDLGRKNVDKTVQQQQVRNFHHFKGLFLLQVWQRKKGKYRLYLWWKYIDYLSFFWKMGQIK